MKARTAFFVVSAVIAGVTLPIMGADWQTNELMIGDTAVPSKKVNGKIAGDKWIVSGNTLVQVHAEVAPIETVAHDSETKKEADSEPVLRLKMKIGSGSWAGKFAGVHGLHGLLYMVKDWRMPMLAQTNQVDILSSSDNGRVVIMVRNNGPIYSSTNSGMTWTVISTPGIYRFPLTFEPDGSSMYAEATLNAAPENQMPVVSSALKWYAVGSGSDGSNLVITGDASQPAPVLSIRHSGRAVIVSWPASFSGFTLQETADLSATNWTDVAGSVQIVGDENQVVIPTAIENNFYRLKSRSP